MIRVGTEVQPLRVAVVGSGPAGFFAATALLQQKEVAARVDLFDRLPTPFGLVRGGVAPDHQHTKSVIKTYEKTAQLPGFRFFGNVTIGRDLEIADLQACYHQIILAVGNETDRPLRVPGADLSGITSATSFVGWYNAHPDFCDQRFDLSSKRVAVIGVGNVAIDVTRILAKQPEALVETDIADHALEALRSNAVEEIVVLGRRGPVQAAFTPAELQELIELPDVSLHVQPEDVDLDPISRQQLLDSGPRSPSRRNLDILESQVNAPLRACNIRMRFCVSPVEFYGDAQGRVRRMRLERNELHLGDDGSLRSRGTGRFEELDVDWVFVSIGYRGEPVPGVPFDERLGRIPNHDGRVFDPEDDRIVPGLYVTGWAKTGPSGLIGPHKKASAAVVQLMLQDRAASQMPPLDLIDDSSVPELLDARGVRYVSFADWRRIDAAEIERGRARGAARLKFSRISEMMDVVGMSTEL